MFKLFPDIHMNTVYVAMVSVYVKKSLSYKIRSQLALTGNEFESLVIEFDKNMFGSKKNIIVGIFYRAPTSSLKIFNKKLETTLDTIQREKKYYV